MKFLAVLTLLLFLSLTAAAQRPTAGRFYSGNSTPSGSCTVGPPVTDFFWRIDTQQLYYCSGGGWTPMPGGGGPGGVADPGANGLMKRTALNVTTPAIAGTDYVAPNGSGASLTGITFSQLGGAALDSQIPDTLTINGTDNVTWASVNKAGSSIADMATRNAGDLSSGTLPAARMPALTGDITTSVGTVNSTITNDAVNNAKLANMANATFKGRTSGGTGDPEDLTAAQATALLNACIGDSGSGGTKGLVPAPGTGDAVRFLRGDCTWVDGVGTGDMLLAGVQTITGAKTFNPAKLIIGNVSSAPTPALGALYVDTDDSKLYYGINGSTWGEVFVSGQSVVNLGSANVTGTTGLANGGTNQTSWTASRCVQVNSAGTALESAAAACGSGGAGTVASATTNQVAYYTGTTTVSGDAGMTYNASTNTLTVDSLTTTGVGASTVEATGAATDIDLNLLPKGAGVVQIGSASNLGYVLSGRLVTAKTGSYTVVAADKNTFFTNTGAGAGITFTLPTPVVGMQYEFYRDANQTVTIDIAGSVTIRVGAGVTTAGGNVTLDAVGSRIRLVAISTTQWVGDISGTGTFN